jgi:hypothetical protein
MIKVEPKPFKRTEHYKAEYTHDKVYSLEIEKTINGKTSYEAYVKFIDNEPVEMENLTEGQRHVLFSVEEAVENHCKRFGIGVEKGEEA